MAKHGILSALPFLAPIAAIAAPFVLPELGAALGIGEAGAAGAAGAEAGAGAAGAAGAGAADIAAATAPAALTAGADIAGTTVLPDVLVSAPAIGSSAVAPALTAGAAAATPFLIPGTDTPISGPSFDAGTIDTGTVSQALSPLSTAGGEALPTTGDLIGPPAGSNIDFFTSTIGEQPGQAATSPFSATAAPASSGPVAPIDPGYAAAPLDLPPDIGNIAGFPPGYDEQVASDLLSPDKGGFLSGARDWYKENADLIKLGTTGLSLGMLGAQALRPQTISPSFTTTPTLSQIPQAQPLSTAATTATTNAANLMAGANQYLSAGITGALPAGAQSAIDAATRAAKTSIKSKFASMGIPPGSSMEGEELASVDRQVAGMKLNEINTLVNQGLQEAQLSQGQSQIASGDLSNIVSAGENITSLAVKTALQQQQNLQSALANFTRALAGPTIATAA